MDHSIFVIEQIEKARVQRGWSEKELAVRAAIDPKRFWRILNHERMLRCDELARLQLVLEISLDKLIHPDTWKHMTQFGEPRGAAGNPR